MTIAVLIVVPDSRRKVVQIDNEKNNVFFFIPGDQLDEVVIQRDASFRIEDWWISTAEKIGRDNLFLSVPENIFQMVLIASSFDRLTDILIFGLE